MKEDRKYIDVLKITLVDAKEPNLITRFSTLLTTPEFDPIVYEATARSLSILLSELDSNKFYIQQEYLVNFLLNQLSLDAYEFET